MVGSSSIIFNLQISSHNLTSFFFILYCHHVSFLLCFLKSPLVAPVLEIVRYIMVSWAFLHLPSLITT